MWTRAGAAAPSDLSAELVDVDASDPQRAWYPTVLGGEHAVEKVARTDPALTAADRDHPSALERELG